MRKDKVDEREVREQVWNVVAQSCLHLDEEKYEQYLELMDEGCVYTISYHSPEIRKDVVLLQHTRQELASLTENIKHHVILPGKLFRQAQLYSVALEAEAYVATSYVTVTHTDEYGASKLFCVARYLDRLVRSGRGMKLRSRHVRMETRDIGSGCHFPL